jgi:DNA-directed RNA polymerase subunit RPC12/RpoP
MKLINYRCVECGQEEEHLLTNEELKEALKEIECLCGGQMTQFNFTNNNTIQKFDWNK